ncbi:MAG: PIG-L deacetylase family protein [Parvibaculaceae bacterium]
MDDIELVSGMLGTETFRRVLRSQPVPMDEAASLLVLAPHQDDEMIGAGGLCIQARKRGIRTAILFMTDGAETGLGRQFGAPMAPEDVIRMREKEARAVCEGLGAAYFELGIDNIKLDVSSSHVTKLAELIRQIAPDVILVPWLLDTAPKHRMVNHLLWLACKRHGVPVREVWGYQVNNAIVANGMLDITADIDEKIALLKLYVSQNELLRRYDYQAWGLAAWNARYLPSKNSDSEARYAELFCMLPLNEHLKLIEQFYFKDLRKTYLGSDKLSTAMSRI